MTYQTGITALGTATHSYFELQISGEVSDSVAVTKLINACNLSYVQSTNIVIGFAPSLWERVAPAEHVPANVHDFSESIVGPDGYKVPATQVDAWLWVSGADRSTVFDTTEGILQEISDTFTVKRQTDGFSYADSRDLTGFEDGTENPGIYGLNSLIAVPSGQSGAGSTVALFQLWPHRVKEWNALSTEAQEKIMGRTKADSIELDDSVKPENSHVSRTVVDVDGEELEIYRRNTAFGSNNRHGTVFVGFSHDQWRMEEMLRRMVGADGGPRDALTFFSDAISSAWFVCPSIEALETFITD